MVFPRQSQYCSDSPKKKSYCDTFPLHSKEREVNTSLIKAENE